MASKQEIRKVTIIADGKKFNASFKQMSASARILENQLKKMPRHTKEWAAKSKELKSVKKDLRGMRTEMNGTRGAMSKITGMFSPMMLGFAGIALVVRNVFNTFKEFQQGAANLASVLGKTRDEITELTDDAKRLGAQTAFTAAEVTNLQTEYAKLGFSKAEIIGVTEATLELAAATGSDLAQSAAVAGGTLRAFNLSVSQSQRVVDVMAKSFSSSALDMEKFTTAMGAVGPVGASAGQSIEQITAKLGVLVNRNIEASTAGTALRNIFLKLAEHGLSWEEAMNKINTAADKNAVALDLFGTRGATVATILAGTAEATAELEAKLNDAAGTAKAMADEQLNTLQGRITKLTSAWDGFILSIEDGDGVIGTFVSGTLEFFTDALRQLSMIGNIFELAFNDIADVSEETLEQLLKFGETEAGNKIAEVLDEAFGQIGNKEFLEGVAANKQAFVDLFVAEGESAEDAAVLWITYLRQRAAGYNNDVIAHMDAIKAKEEADELAISAQAERERLRQVAAEEEALKAAEKKQLENIKEQEEWDANEQKNDVRLAKKKAQEKSALDQRLQDLNDYNDEKLSEIDKAYKIELEKLAAQEDLKKDISLAALNAVNQLTDAALANRARSQAFFFSEERNRVTEKFDTEIRLLKERLETGQINETQFAQAKRTFEKRQAEDLYKIKVAEFKSEKKIAFGKIAIDTAIGIAKAFSQFGWPLGIVPAAFVAGAGIVQAGVVALQQPPPRPQFAKGGLTDVGTFKYGGNINEPSQGIIAEAGSEWVGPNWMLESPKFADIFSYLESERTRGMQAFAAGGGTGTQIEQTPSVLSDEDDKRFESMDNKLGALISIMSAWPTKLQVHNNVQDTVDAIQTLNEIEADSEIMRVSK